MYSYMYVQYCTYVLICLVISYGSLRIWKWRRLSINDLFGILYLSNGWDLLKLLLIMCIAVEYYLLIVGSRWLVQFHDNSFHYPTFRHILGPIMCNCPYQHGCMATCVHVHTEEWNNNSLSPFKLARGVRSRYLCFKYSTSISRWTLRRPFHLPTCQHAS